MPAQSAPVQFSQVVMIERFGRALGRLEKKVDALSDEVAFLQAQKNTSLEKRLDALSDKVAFLETQKNTSVVHTGTWDATREYHKGEAVGWHDCWWVATGPVQAGAEPGTIPEWGLGARGARGKPGRQGPPGPKGDPG